VLATMLAATACTSTDEKIAAMGREALGPKVVAEFCAMSETERSAYLTKRLQKTNASAVNINGKWYDSTLVTSREFGEERHAWRKTTGVLIATMIRSTAITIARDDVVLT
jgi:hypothetical protein